MSKNTPFFRRGTLYYRLLLLLPAAVLFACDDLVTVDTPKTEITDPAVYQDDATATAAVVGIYAKMSESSYFNNVGIPMLTGLSADEFVDGSYYGAFEQNQVDVNENELLVTLWEPGYKFIYYANAVLKGLENENGVSAPVRRSLQGQAYFVRALCYFYLVNLFGNLPKVVSTDFTVNQFLPREPVDSIHALIDKDLARAVSLLPEDFATGYQQERTLPTRWAAHALQARVALYRGQWSRAASEADSVIVHKNLMLFSLPAPDIAFNHDSEEAIWQIKPIYISQFLLTTEASMFVMGDWVYLRPSLLEAFEPDDQRSQWIGVKTFDEVNFLYYPYKYRYVTVDEGGTEYHIEFRLAEQYLIRAEARAYLGDLEGAIADLDAIRARAGLPLLAGMGITWTRDLVLARVMQERRVELFSEGHRWFDLIRTGQARTTLENIEGKLWDDTDILYPVPASELRKNRFLEPQNDGY